VRLSGLDRIERGAAGGDTIFNGKVKRGGPSNGLGGLLKDASKKHPSGRGMTLVVGVSETPKLLA